MNGSLPSSIENEVINLRTGKIPYPATEIAKKLNISVWEVYKALEKYDRELNKINRHKQADVTRRILLFFIFITISLPGNSPFIINRIAQIPSIVHM